MGATIVGVRLLYGAGMPKPILPQGFKYFEREGHWLLAEGPDEKLYYVSFDRLYRMRTATWWDVVKSWVRTRGKYHLREGQMFMDSKETIYIKHLQHDDEKCPKCDSVLSIGEIHKNCPKQITKKEK